MYDDKVLFKSEAQILDSQRRATKSVNKWGNPIQLQSKLAGAVLDPHKTSSRLFVAESAGSVRRIDIDDVNPKPMSLAYSGPSAPITSVCVGGPSSSFVFAGCWDKTVWSWDITTGKPSHRYTGHADFVKAVICAKLDGKHVLISGGADRKIMVWDIETGKRMHVLQDRGTGLGSMLGVQSLVIDPVESSEEKIVIVSAGSDPFIRRWEVELGGWVQLEDAAVPDASSKTAGGKTKKTEQVHDTGIYQLLFDDADEDADLWTASADGTSKCLARQDNFKITIDTFNHAQHIRALALTQIWVITAGRDEDIKIWDRSSGELLYTLQGHFDEITGLALLEGAAGNINASRLVSFSLDGTIRMWPLRADALTKLVAEQAKAAEGVQDQVIGEKEERGKNGVTAEEEAELAALMDEE